MKDEPKSKRRRAQLRYMGQCKSVINRGRRSSRLNSFYVFCVFGSMLRKRRNGISPLSMPLLRSRTQWKTPTTFIFRIKLHEIAVIVYLLRIYCFIWKWNWIIFQFFLESCFVACVGAFRYEDEDRTGKKVQLISWWALVLAARYLP